jgi:uncharacterized membrane protein
MDKKNYKRQVIHYNHERVTLHIKIHIIYLLHKPSSEQAGVVAALQACVTEVW